MKNADLFAHAGVAFGGSDMLPLAGTPIDEGQVVGLAEEMTGLGDWGPDDSFRTGLRVLIDSIEELERTPEHRHLFRRQIVHFLGQRLRLRDDEVHHPEILDGPIERPMVIIGNPRSGTTLLHELLALDPRARAPRNWEYAAPWPAPEIATFDTDPRIALVDASWAKQRAASPELANILPTSAVMPSECNDSMMFHFASPNYWAWFHVPSYTDWYAQETPEGTYRTHRRILQQLQWKGPTGRWTLKAPCFVGDPLPIIEAYPDACLVWTHRDPSTSFVSLASLVSSLQNALLGERPDPAEMAMEVRVLWGGLLKRGLAQRQDPSVAAAVYDVSYADLVADKVGTVAKIYDRFGLELSAEHRDRIARFEQAEPSSQYAKHLYSADEYDLDPAGLREELADYHEEFSHFWTGR